MAGRQVGDEDSKRDETLDLGQYPIPLSPPHPEISRQIELRRAMSASSMSSLFSLSPSHILFQDDCLAVLNKPPGISTKPKKPSSKNPFRQIATIGQGFFKRNRTLLEDYKRSRKSSVFTDRRIGEGDDALGEFDKSILRLQRVRQMKVKKESKYNLSDGEEELEGDLFSKVDDFDEEVPLDEDQEIGINDDSKKDRFLHLQKSSTETSLSAEDPKKPKSKKQVYEEIMAKSKFHKAMKAKERETDEQLLGQLDKDFLSLAQSKALISLTQPTKLNALKSLVKPNEKKLSLKEGTPNKPPLEDHANKEKPDKYDMLIKEMALEACARPSDRTKTPEEIAQEEKEYLQLLEDERKKRMLTTEDSDDEGNAHAASTHMLAKIAAHVSGDDLGNAESFDSELPEKKGWADAILERGKVNDVDVATSDDDAEIGIDADSIEGDDDSCTEEDEEGDNNFDETGEDGSGSLPESFILGSDWEESDKDLDADEEKMKKDSGQKNGMNNLNDQTVISNLCLSSHAGKSEIQGTTKVEPLPFVIDAPKTMAELCLLLDNRSDTEIIEAVNRIRVCNAVKLSAENRKKMQVFYGVLLQYFAILTSKKPLNIKLVNLLVKPLVEISMDTPYFAAICARERLTRIRKQLCEDMKDLEKSSWPSLKTLMVLRLWCLTFPCSDFRHVVMTPATLLICEYLMRCPVVHCRDTAVGSFLCSMLLLVAEQSCKFFPEAVIFLQILLMSALNVTKLQNVSQCYEFLNYRTAKPWLFINGQVSHVQPIDFFATMELPVDSPTFDSDIFKASVLSSAVEALGGFANVYRGLRSFPEIFLPISSLLLEVSNQHAIPVSLKDRMENIAGLIKKSSEEHHLSRQPLQMRQQKPVPLKLINPRFEENYEKGRDYDPDRERVERKKLKKLLKKEAKGAVRELRKDNYFLLEVKERDRLLLEEERAEKYGKAKAFLQEQEHAFKSGQLGKGRKGRKRRR